MGFGIPVPTAAAQRRNRPGRRAQRLSAPFCGTSGHTRAVPEPAEKVDSGTTWFTPGVRGIGAASLLSDLGHEVPTAHSGRRRSAWPPQLRSAAAWRVPGRVATRPYLHHDKGHHFRANDEAVITDEFGHPVTESGGVATKVALESFRSKMEDEVLTENTFEELSGLAGRSGG
jgi:hypothetical protein